MNWKLFAWGICSRDIHLDFKQDLMEKNVFLNTHLVQIQAIFRVI